MANFVIDSQGGILDVDTITVNIEEATNNGRTVLTGVSWGRVFSFTQGFWSCPIEAAQVEVKPGQNVAKAKRDMANRLRNVAHHINAK